ncbi:hypothetical protein A6R68_20063, partial [Neotoma lepida]
MGKPGPTTQALKHGRFPTLLGARPEGHQPQYSQPPVQREVMGSADNQGAGKQGRLARLHTCQCYKLTDFDAQRTLNHKRKRDKSS